METENFSLSAPGVMEKYQEAGKIAREAMTLAISKCVEGADVYQICKEVTESIHAACKKSYVKSKIEKGPSFPVCVSLNKTCGHFSPLSDESVKLQNGDVAKIDLGVHIDGFPVIMAHTVVVGGLKEQDTDLKRLLSGTYHALETMVKSLKPGESNTSVTNNVSKVLSDFKLSALEGVLSHEVGKYTIKGDSCIGISASPEHKVNESELQVNQIFVLDMLVSLNPSEGKTKESEQRSTVFKRNIDVMYDLKTKTARLFLNDIKTNCHDMAFSISQMDNILEARVGSNECLKNGHLESFPVVEEKSGAIVAQFKWTVAISKKRLILLAHNSELGFELDPLSENILKDETVGPVLKKSLVEMTANKKKKKTKK